MRSEHIAILKSKISSLSGALTQAESDLDSITQSRLKAIEPSQKKIYISQAVKILAEKSRIIREIHTLRRLLARSDGDEFDFDTNTAEQDAAANP